MTRRMYDLCGATDDKRFSPYCWRTRMALAHKGLTAEFVPVRFSNIVSTVPSENPSVPVLVDGDKTITDSWDTAVYLDETYPDTPTLFRAGADKRHPGFISAWAATALHPAIARVIVGEVFDLIHEEDKEFFRKSREERFGKTIEALKEEGPSHAPALAATLAPLRILLSQQSWVSGIDGPDYNDYIVFGAFQWLRLISSVDPCEKDDPIIGWREHMLDMFDGYARSFPAAA